MMKTRGPVKDAEYYLSLRYPVLVQELAPEDGGGYRATIPQLGGATFVGDGETPEEALASLDAARRYLIPKLIEKGVELPEPEPELRPLEQFSGNLPLRISRSLHAQAAATARREGCSINKLVTEILAAGLKERQLLHPSVSRSRRRAAPTAKREKARS